MTRLIATKMTRPQQQELKSLHDHFCNNNQTLQQNISTLEENPDLIKKTLQHFYHYVIENGANPNSSEINPIDENSNTTMREKIFNKCTTYRATRKKKLSLQTEDLSLGISEDAFIKKNKTRNSDGCCEMMLIMNWLCPDVSNTI